MALPQDISPVNSLIMDTLVKAADTEADWIQTGPKSWTKVLFTGSESGCWAVLFRWNKGFVAGRHKHLSASHTYILKGKLQVRDGILEAGDYVYEANGMIHDETKALEDTEYLFICEGPLLGFDDNGFRGYQSWEQLQRRRDAHRG
jgi:anti-sigma factor ChrR (cupin superfamily)